MFQLKMTGVLYDDVKTVHEGVKYLCSMFDYLEQECIIRDKDKPATELFIRINDMKNTMEKLFHESERMLRMADIDQFGPLSEYVRPYLGFKKID